MPSKPDKSSESKSTEPEKLIHQATSDTSKNHSESTEKEDLSRSKVALDKTSFSPLARRNTSLVNEKINTSESSKDSTNLTKNKELPQTSSNAQQSIDDEVIGSVALSIGLIGLAGVKKRKKAR